MVSINKKEGVEFFRWQAEGVAIAVEFRRDVLEEIRRRADEGFQKVGYGGIEHGGVLFGRVQAGVCTVLEWRQLPCEHASGPSFTLSESDRKAMAELASASDPALAGLKAVGWWVSHGRSKVALKAHDVEVHSSIFPAAEQFVLVLKPAREGATATGIFVRDASGNLNPDSPADPFEIGANTGAIMGPKRSTSASSAAASMEAPAARQSAHRSTARPAAPVAPPAVSEPASQPPEPAFLTEAPLESKRWTKLLLVAGFAAALAAVAVYLPNLLEGRPESAALRVEEQRDQLFIRWEGEASSLRRADRGALEIHDGGPLQVIALDRDEVRAGTVTYIRRSTDVQVRLTLYRGGDAVMQEFTRYLGPPVSSPQAALAPVGAAAERAQLTAENERLSSVLQQEVSRNVRLQESIQTLETRLRQEDVRRANTLNP